MSGGTVLYHGSHCVVRVPDLSRCAPGKDFGRGFYLTTDLEQARKFVATSVRKAVARGVEGADPSRGFVSAFEFVPSAALSRHDFPEADIAWLRCVVAHRRRGCVPGELEKWAGQDLICGKIADDRTNSVIAAFLDGVYGPVESERAAELAIGFLEPGKLRDQWCFRTEKALACLKFVSAEEVPLWETR